MRRSAAIALILLAAGLAAAWPATGDAGEYRVRAIFDNGGFIVPGEEVRVAGARVGTVDAVDVSGTDEVVSVENGDRVIPGKAVVVLAIEDAGFKDFRQDASCLIRPQSLIGEKFVECLPTQPRAPAEEPPPELDEIAQGEPGEGQHLLPLENNGKAVDLDLVQNIMRYPYRERFRLILNDLGAGLAARGEELGEVVERANPALRQTDRVLAILAQQNRQLASLASDGDAVLEPLARERQSITGFISNTNTTAQATAERRIELEQGLQKLPAALREVRLTMRDLRGLGEQAVPVFDDLNEIAPDLSRAIKALGPFTEAATPALESLGDAAGETGPLLVEADDLFVDLRSLGNRTRPAARHLKRALDTLGRSRGFNHLTDFIYNAAGSLNGFDSIGHTLRTNLLVTACVEYEIVPFPGCVADWGNIATAAAAIANQPERRRSDRDQKEPPIEAAPAPVPMPPVGIEELPELEPPPAPGEGIPGEPPPVEDEKLVPPEGAPAPMRLREAEMLLQFLFGSRS